MKKSFIVILLMLLFVGSIEAQEKEHLKIVESFTEAYKNNNYKSFYELYSPQLKLDLSYDDMVSFYQKMKAKLGEVTSIEFYGWDDKGNSLFKTKFDNGDEVLLNLSIDKQNQLLGFQILDFSEDREIDSSFLQESYEDLIFQAALELPNKGQFAIALIDGDVVDFIGLKKNGSAISVIDNKQSVFSIGNFNTLFTATLLAKAINEKKIGLSDDVNSYYPFEFKDSVRLSFSSLANNSTFLPVLPTFVSETKSLKDQDAYYFGYTTSDLESYLQNNLQIDSLNLERRSRFSYVGYALLGETLSRVFNKDFTELVQENVFVPYKMKSTSLVQNPKKKALLGVDMDGDEVVPFNFNLLRTSTGGFSTLEDIVHFVQASFNPTDANLQLIQKPTLMIGPKFWAGMGWKISNPTQPERIVYFSKGIDVGYCNYIGFSPLNKKGVVVLTNSSTATTLDAMDDLAFKLMHKLLENE